MLFQEIFGISDYIKQRAEDLAALGYVVLAPEFYWRLDDTGVDETQPDFLDQALAVAGRVDWAAAVADGVAALETLRADEHVHDGVGVFGFCFGGGLAFNVAAEANPDVLVSYYGSALANLLDLAPRVRAPSLHHFGLADSYIPPDTQTAIRTAIERPGVQVETHPGAGHAFDNPHPVFHDAAASATAWATTVDFLARHLPPG